MAAAPATDSGEGGTSTRVRSARGTGPVLSGIGSAWKAVRAAAAEP